MQGNALEISLDFQFGPIPAIFSAHAPGDIRLRKEYRVEINMKKTKVMVISNKGDKTRNVTEDGRQLEQEQQYKYLGSLITDDGDVNRK